MLTTLGGLKFRHEIKRTSRQFWPGQRLHHVDLLRFVRAMPDAAARIGDRCGIFGSSAKSPGSLQVPCKHIGLPAAMCPPFRETGTRIT